MERGDGDIFQTVILRHASGMYGARNIREQIDSVLYLWNKVAYDDLVQS